MTAGADRLAEIAFRMGWSALGALPDPITAALFNAGADAAYRRCGPGVRQFARNLHRVLGPAATPPVLAGAVRAGLRSYARYWRETFTLPTMDPAEVAARALAGTVGVEYLDAAQNAGRGVLMALPHSGNWDVAGLFIARRYGSLTTVAERLRPEGVYRRFVAYRESLGFEVLPLDGGPAVSAALRARLAAGGIVCLLGDRDLADSGVAVRFFGEQARMPAGPAMLAAVTGADLCPVHLTFTPGGWRQVVSAPLQLPGRRLAQQVRGATQALADHYAAGIAAAPHDWHMMQPLWQADRRTQNPGEGTGSANPLSGQIAASPARLGSVKAPAP